MEKEHNFKILSGFILKILALIFMTIDHIGFFMQKYENLREITEIFRILGRFSFPLIIFLLVEGIKHTKDIKKYFTRLSLLAFAFFIGQMINYIFISKNSTMLSPAIDLLLTGSCIYLLSRKDKYSYLASLPIVWAIISMIARNYEFHHLVKFKWFPFFLRPDYYLYGPLLGIGFYYSTDLARLFLNSKEETKTLIGTSFERTTSNLISGVFVFVITIALTFIDRYLLRSLYTSPWQIYAVFSLIPILLYSGLRGSNAKWFQYGCYFYFPMHLVIIFTIFALL